MAALRRPVRSIYRGVTWPKFVAFRITDECADACLAATTVEGTRLAEVAQQWHEMYGLEICNVAAGAKPLSLVQQPCHQSLLISRGLWTSIVFTARMKFDTTCDMYGLRVVVQDLLRGGVSDAPLQRTATAHLRSDGIVEGSYRWVADLLRQWSPSILAAAEDEDDAVGRRLQLEQAITWLSAAEEVSDRRELIASRLQMRVFGDWNTELGHFASYQSAFLLECLVMSFALRDAGTLETSFKQAVRLLPPVWSSSLGNLMRDGQCMPSAATLSRARLYVDVGYMLFRQNYHEGLIHEEFPPALYGLIDSSPQGGRNWELFELDCIRGQYVQE